MLIIDWFLSFRRVNQKVFLLKIISNASASGGKDESNTTVKHYNAFNWVIHFSPSDKFILASFIIQKMKFIEKTL